MVKDKYNRNNYSIGEKIHVSRKLYTFVAKGQCELQDEKFCLRCNGCGVNFPTGTTRGIWKRG